jgi:hypothetical protein
VRQQKNNSVSSSDTPPIESQLDRTNIHRVNTASPSNDMLFQYILSEQGKEDLFSLKDDDAQSFINWVQEVSGSFTCTALYSGQLQHD